MSRQRLQAWIEQGWYSGAAGLTLLRPLSWLTSRVASRRLANFQRHRQLPPIPTIVVGNLTVGGTGKTPMVVALVNAAKQQGLRPAVLSRGYGGSAKTYPLWVNADSDASHVGDEPLLIARRTGVPVVLAPQRRRALDAIVQHGGVDLLISDDGLQHFDLPRTVELVVIDGARGLGNGRCLPEGPLRELPTRLDHVDVIISNGSPWPGASLMQLVSDQVVSLDGTRTMHMADFLQQHPKVHAVAGIGHPQRFFSGLADHGFEVDGHPFPDHHQFSPEDLAFSDPYPVLMTEKDAMKCSPFAAAHHWVVPVDAALPDGVLDSVIALALQRHSTSTM